MMVIRAKLNCQEHNNFRKSTNELREWIHQNGVSAVEVVSLRMDLEAWLVHHICFVDAKACNTSGIDLVPCHKLPLLKIRRRKADFKNINQYCASFLTSAKHVSCIA